MWPLLWMAISVSHFDRLCVMSPLMSPVSFVYFHLSVTWFSSCCSGPWQPLQSCFFQVLLQCVNKQQQSKPLGHKRPAPPVFLTRHPGGVGWESPAAPGHQLVAVDQHVCAFSSWIQVFLPLEIVCNAVVCFLPCVTRVHSELPSGKWRKARGVFV